MTKTQLSDPELLRYSRQILLPEWDMAAQLNLANARVLMVGAGGLGNPAAQILVRAGLGFLRIVDFDVIEESNLQRQFLFQSSDIGCLKVAVAARELQKISPWTYIEPVDLKADLTNLPPLLADIDLVLDGSDNFATRDLVNQACMQAQVPLLSAAAIGLEGQLAFFMPEQGCYHCVFSDGLDNDTRQCNESGVLASTPAVMASLQAHHALLYLGLKQIPLLNKLLVWNGITMQQRVLKFAIDPDCTVCQLKQG
ncbi:HesA/MoeB/ThiF family protein [Alkanindiges sp. WGS2144]|uniref:HesA/MoeB/ThiF family protein n=1 Tax=Alkanindiges sp. WGS2144 TaxID=3366808 RepID=UPI0037526A63